MFRRRRKKSGSDNQARTQNPPSPAAPGSPPSPPGPGGGYREAKNPPPLTDAFKGAIEKAAERAKKDLAATGKLGPTAFFVHKDGTMKVAALSFRAEHQQDAVIRRIKEKASAENAFAVMVLSEQSRGRRGMILSAATPGVRASARVDYSFDKETKTVTSWKLSWLEKPIANIFLDSVFDGTQPSPPEKPTPNIRS